MRIAAYCRVSTDKEDQLNSLEAQKEFFTEYAGRTGGELVRLYADEGISGTKIKNRTEFLRMMADAQRHSFDMVVVKDISRFARNTVDLLQSVRRLRALGIETQFLTAGMTNMGGSELMLTMFGAIAQEESANTSKRVKFGKKLNAQKGRVPNIVYGYDKTAGDYFNLTVNPAEAGTVRRIFHMYTEEGAGAAKIANALNERGLRTKRGCVWSQNAVCRILRNPIYTGKIINGKQEVADFLTGRRADRPEEDWIVLERPELRIVPPETFQRAGEIMEARRGAFSAGRQRQSSRHLFSTIIKCRDCGRTFYRTERTYKNTYVRWTCSGRGSGCPNGTSLDEDELIAALQDYFAGILKAKKNIVSRVVKELVKECQAGEGGPGREKELSARLEKLKKTRQKYLDMYAEDLISREELDGKLGELGEELERTERELETAAGPGARAVESALRGAFRTVEDIADVRGLTNAQLKRIIERIEVGGDGGVDVYLRALGEPGGPA